jgi:hypothetical protein
MKFLDQVCHRTWIENQRSRVEWSSDLYDFDEDGFVEE